MCPSGLFCGNFGCSMTVLLFTVGLGLNLKLAGASYFTAKSVDT